MSEPHPLVDALSKRLTTLVELVAGTDEDGVVDVQNIADALDDHEEESLLGLTLQVHEENQQLREEVTHLEGRLESLEKVVHDDSKQSKVEKLVDYANNKRTTNAHGDQQRAVVLTVQEIIGATGCSRRYAYDIIDEWGNQYGFFVPRKDVSQYGDLEREDREERGRGLMVVFDGTVHNAVESVNRFTTRNASEGGEA